MLTGQAKTDYQRAYMRKRRLDPAIQASERRAGRERAKNNGHNAGTCEVCGYSETIDTHHDGLNKEEHILCPNCHALITRGLTTLEELRSNTKPKVRVLVNGTYKMVDKLEVDAEGNEVPEYE